MLKFGIVLPLFLPHSFRIFCTAAYCAEEDRGSWIQPATEYLAVNPEKSL